MQNFSPVKHYDPAEDAAELLSRLGYIMMFVGVPLGAALSRRALFLIFPIAIVLMLGAALLILSRESRKKIFGFEMTALAASASFLLVWSAASLLWTPNLNESLSLLVKAVLTIGFGFITCRALAPQTRTANIYVLSVGLLLALLAALILIGRKAPDGTVLFDIRAGVTFAVLAWPATAALAIRKRVGWAGALAILVAMTLMLTGQTMSFVILASSALAFSASLSSRAAVAKWLGIGFSTLIVLAPLAPIILSFFVSDGADNIFAESLAAVKQVGVSDGARLITGRGFGASGRSPLAEPFPLTAHSLLFEIWFDLGALGALTMAALVYRAFISAARSTSAIGPFVTGGLTCIVLFGIFGQGYAQIWWVTLLSVTAIAFKSVANGLHQRHRPAGMRTATSPA